MLSLIEQIKKGKLWRYLGGVHPTENKSQSTGLASTTVSLPSHLIIPVKQHIGGTGKVLVEVGDRVLKGQALTASDSFMTVPVHAPTSGIIEDIDQYPSTHPSSIPELAIKLRCDLKDIAIEQQPALDYTQLSTAELQNHISQAGVAGMGGAGFPTAVKLSDRQPIDFLLINAAECEPYITSDDVLMREYADDIVQGINILQHMIKPQICIIGIEDNKAEAAQALQQAIAAVNQEANILVRQVPTKYPNGGEKQLIKVLTGKEIGKGEIPAHSGIVMQNVGTVYAVKQAVIDRQPLLDRIVTLTGQGFSQPRNVRALIGTPIEHLLAEFHCNKAQTEALIYGGPMMGFTLPHSQFSLTKTGNCILAAGKNEVPQIREADACIRCGECAEVCPMDLLPQQLHWYSQAKDVDKLTDYNLKDCIECGACSYVCPSQIPLVHQYRIAKVEVREHEESLAAAAIAKEKFEKRNARLEQEKQQREQRQKEAAEKRRATAQASTGEDPVKAAMERIQKAKQAESAPSSTPKSDAVAQALARAKAKKAAAASGEPDNSAVIAQREVRKAEARARKAEKDAGATPTVTSEQTPSVDAKKAAVAAAIARAKAKKAGTAESTPAVTSEETPSIDAKKAAVAAAIARAKAKKAGTAESTPTVTSEETPSVDAKKAAVAAAIARAKAKKAGTAESTPSVTSEETPSVDAKKAAVAAAIARAKAKKATQAQVESAADDSSTTDVIEEATPAVDPKKAAVAAAIARAKAKKAAQAQAESPTDDSSTTDAIEEATPAVDPKKAAVAAAIAKAKAKKAAQAQVENAADDSSTTDVIEAAAPAVDPKKAAVAAAIARAKAKKAAQAQVESAADDSSTTDVIEAAAPAVDPKKAAVAAAIVRAKAKKAAQAQTESTTDDSSTTDVIAAAAPATETTDHVGGEVATAEPVTKTDAKKAAIAAAIAKAKARKLAQAGDK